MIPSRILLEAIPDAWDFEEPEALVRFPERSHALYDQGQLLRLSVASALAEHCDDGHQSPG